MAARAARPRRADLWSDAPPGDNRGLLIGMTAGVAAAP